MSYTPIKQQPRNDLDILGTYLGFNRLKDESLSDYRRRLLGETVDRSGATQKELVSTLSRRVGKFDLPVFDIDLLTDGDGVPLASNPMIEVTSSHIRAYPVVGEDPEIELNFYNPSDGKFLIDILTAFSGSSYFSITSLANYEPWLVSRNLQFGSSVNYVDREILLDSVENKLKYNFILNLYPTNPQIFVTEVMSLNEVTELGKYYVDYQNGVIFTYSTMGGIVSYFYNQFPYRLFWQPIKIYPYTDVDKKYFHRNTVIDDDGNLAYQSLNSKGVEVANLVYSAHPLTWGK